MINLSADKNGVLTYTDTDHNHFRYTSSYNRYRNCVTIAFSNEFTMSMNASKVNQLLFKYIYFIFKTNAVLYNSLSKIF